MLKRLLLLLLLIPGIAFAEFTDYEKAQMKKLHDVGALIGGTFETAMQLKLSPYAWGTLQHNLRVSTGLLLHVQPGRLNKYDIRYPETYDVVIPGRAEIVQKAVGLIPGTISHIRSRIESPFVNALSNCTEACEKVQKAVDDSRAAILLLESFDTSAAYGNPLLPGFPQQFGERIVDGKVVLIHGDYRKVQGLIFESRRLLFYSVAWANFRHDRTAIKTNKLYARCTSGAFNILSRISLLGANIVVSKWDQGKGLETNTDARAFRSIDIALGRRGLPSYFACAIKGSSYHGDTEALRDANEAWRWSDSWVNEFLKITL